MSPRRSGGRGGKGGYEPRLRIRQREQEVVQLATEGRSQHDIARALGLSQAAVSKILRRVDDRWMRDNVTRIARYRAEQTRKLEHLFREALHAWETSKAQRTRRRQRKTDATDPSKGGTMAEVVVDDSHGDPRYLEAARRALADLGRVWNGATPTTPGPEELPVFTLRIGDANLSARWQDAPAPTPTPAKEES